MINLSWFYHFEILNCGMSKRLGIYLVLFSMTLHCACRLGFIDYIYNNRNEIGYALGLVSELRITVCSNNYNSGKNLRIVVGDSSSSTPNTVFKTEHINLFFVPLPWNPHTTREIHNRQSRFTVPNFYKLQLVTSVFHPPSMG
jgi:hypothetical protein